jgi:hypothetical protein
VHSGIAQWSEFLGVVLSANTHLQSGFSHACLKPLLGCLCNGAGHFPFAGVEFEAIVLPGDVDPDAEPGAESDL